jgi:hypothetical protein
MGRLVPGCEEGAGHFMLRGAEWQAQAAVQAGAGGEAQGQGEG